MLTLTVAGGQTVHSEPRGRHPSPRIIDDAPIALFGDEQFATRGCSAVTYLIVLLLLGLAAANGANDVSKGVATLAGAGVAAYRTAIVWGAVTTLLGGLLSIQLGRDMGKLFSTGIVNGAPTGSFALAVLVGTTAWVALASFAKLPVSTTHALVGSLVGAGLVLGRSAVQWHGVLQKVVIPLLTSIVVAYAIAAAVALTLQAATRIARRRTRVRVGAGGAEDDTAVEPDSAPAGRRGSMMISALHWISSGATGCARGLNDTPKIAAIGGFYLIPAGFSGNTVALLVVAAMATGSLLGIRVARTLGEKVVRMSHTEGFLANATTATLVTVGALRALPMSTTHVSTGAIVGSAGGQLNRISGKTLRDFVIAWTVTPLFTAAVAALVYFVVR
jgi:inorganic phosphate transporter, PiT family